MRKHVSTVIFSIIFIAGLSLLLYPSVSDCINSIHQSKAITEYAEQVSVLSEEECRQSMEEAVDYNRSLAAKGNPWSMSDEEKKKYEHALNVSDNGVMSYVEIPKIHCYLPIYHGTDEGTLQTSIGHIPGTSLPIGGVPSHCVLSGHRGLPSAKLFSELDKLIIGDQFFIRTLNEEITYEVDQILIVLPEEVDSVKIEQGRDYCTLVTCTPYGVNSHRLLVRGARVENQRGSHTVRVVSDAIQIEPVIVAPVVALPILLLLVVMVMMRKPEKNYAKSEVTL